MLWNQKVQTDGTAPNSKPDITPAIIKTEHVR
jgi:hypothetical protein